MDFRYFVTASQLKPAEAIPNFGIGDTVAAHLRVIEGDKERLQVFQGTVIARRGGGLSEMFTIRKLSNGVGVERILPLHCPTIAKLEIIKRGSVRRAKLYYLRSLTGKATRVKEKSTYKKVVK